MRHKIPVEEDSFVSSLDSWLRKAVGQEVVFIVAGADRYLEILSKKYKEFSVKVRLTFPKSKVPFIYEVRKIRAPFKSIWYQGGCQQYC